MPENAKQSVVNLGNLSFTERAPVIGWHIMEWVGVVVQRYIYLGQYQPDGCCPSMQQHPHSPQMTLRKS